MRPYALPSQVTLDANGDGAVMFTAREDLTVTHTRVSVSPAPGAAFTVRQPRALVYVNGVEFEGTYTGGGDQSGTQYVLAATDTVECRWTGGDPGAAARLVLRAFGGV